MIKSPAEMTASEIDTELARIWDRRWTVQMDLSTNRTRLDTITRKIAVGTARSWDHSDAERLPEYIATLETEVAALTAEADPYEAEYARRGGWLRYFLVTNGNGHVHREMTCSTCYPTTSFGWLPELSDCDEAAMITEFGEKACTICFPDAPANPQFHAPGRRDAEAIAARAAEKAQRQAAKDAKAITAPDGGPLLVPDGTHRDRTTGETRQSYNRINTKVAAQRELSSAVQSFGWYGDTHPSDFAAKIRVLSEALTAAGIDPLPIIARANKKVRAEGGTHQYQPVMA